MKQRTVKGGTQLHIYEEEKLYARRKSAVNRASLRAPHEVKMLEILMHLFLLNSHKDTCVPLSYKNGICV